MTSYIIINTIITFVLLLFALTLFFWARQNNFFKSISPNTQTDSKEKLSWRIKLSLTLAFVFIVVSFFTPFLFTRSAITEDFNFSKTGEIGDTISGLMNPFISLAGVIITGLAFYMQYKANLLQRELFTKEQETNKKQFQIQLDKQDLQNRIQQFESQFYEMLRLHRENVSEMRITGYDFMEGENFKKVDRITQGRKVFVTMQTEFECILKIYLTLNKLDDRSFNICYTLFFSGIGEFEKRYSGEKEFIKKIKEARKQHQNDSRQYNSNDVRKKFESDIKLNFNYNPFSGHDSRLGHYFRHLYLIVKSIVNSDIISEYDHKMRYLKILRAQLSNHEQIFLFYNWLSNYGGEWENENNQYFTEYCMIHNLWYNKLLGNEFIKGKVDYLRNKNVSLRPGEMFEID